MLDWKSWSFTAHKLGDGTSEGHLCKNVDKDHAEFILVITVETSMTHVANDTPWLEWKCTYYLSIEVLIGEIHYGHHATTSDKTKSTFHCAHLSMIVSKVGLLHINHLLLLLLLVARSIQILMFQFLDSCTQILYLFAFVFVLFFLIDVVLADGLKHCTLQKDKSY